MTRYVLLALAVAAVVPALPASAEWCDRLAVNVSCDGPSRHCDVWVRGQLGTASRCVVLDDIVHVTFKEKS